VQKTAGILLDPGRRGTHRKEEADETAVVLTVAAGWGGNRLSFALGWRGGPAAARSGLWMIGTPPGYVEETSSRSGTAAG